MKPILVQLGPIPIQSFGLFLLLAFAIGLAPLGVCSVIGPSGPGFFVALVGARAVAAAYARSAKIGFRRFLDVIAPPITVGYAAAMIGALLAGSIYPAKATDVPRAVTVVFQEVHPVA